MPDESYRPLGHLAGTAIGVRPTLNGQDLLITIRYAHPAMVQLEMILPPDDP